MTMIKGRKRNLLAALRNATLPRRRVAIGPASRRAGMEIDRRRAEKTIARHRAATDHLPEKAPALRDVGHRPDRRVGRPAPVIRWIPWAVVVRRCLQRSIWSTCGKLIPKCTS